MLPFYRLATNPTQVKLTFYYLLRSFFSNILLKLLGASQPQGTLCAISYCFMGVPSNLMASTFIEDAHAPVLTLLPAFFSDFLHQT